MEKSSGLSYTLQMNNLAASQNPSALKRATVCGESRRGQLESRVVFFLLTPSHVASRRQRGVGMCLVRVGECVHTDSSSSVCDICVNKEELSVFIHSSTPFGQKQ